MAALQTENYKYQEPAPSIHSLTVIPLDDWRRSREQVLRKPFLSEWELNRLEPEFFTAKSAVAAAREAAICDENLGYVVRFNKIVNEEMARDSAELLNVEKLKRDRCLNVIHSWKVHVFQVRQLLLEAKAIEAAEAHELKAREIEQLRVDTLNVVVSVAESGTVPKKTAAILEFLAGLVTPGCYFVGSASASSPALNYYLYNNNFAETTVLDLFAGMREAGQVDFTVGEPALKPIPKHWTGSGSESDSEESALSQSSSVAMSSVSSSAGGKGGGGDGASLNGNGALAPASLDDTHSSGSHSGDIQQPEPMSPTTIHGSQVSQLKA